MSAGLVDVVPYTAAKEQGLIHIMPEAAAPAWVEAHAADLVAAGYVTVVIRPHRLGGRAWRWFKQGDGQ